MHDLAPVARPLEWMLREIEAHATRGTGRSSRGWAIAGHSAGSNGRPRAAPDDKILSPPRPHLPPQTHSPAF